jgi:formate dehydrogenase iron-sulfur subunit
VTALAEPTGSPAAWPDTYGDEAKPRMGFFTDTSVCIGCKACEVACKEWNVIPEDGLVWTGESYDNTSTLGANSWRHVAFIEQRKPSRVRPASAPAGPSPAPPAPRTPEGDPIHVDGEVATIDFGEVANTAPLDAEPLRWLMSSDVCKHCTHAACLDVCPTGSLFRTEFGTVVVQEDICNGCGYCVPACPFGVLDKRDLPRSPSDAPLALPILGKKEDGRVWKCTLCYDRLKGGHEPACAKACPTDSIQFGPLDELRERAERRLDKLQTQGWNGAQLYGHDPSDGVGGFGAFFLLLDDPEVYGLPPDPVVTTRDLPAMWAATAVAAAAAVVGTALAFIGGRG